MKTDGQNGLKVWRSFPGGRKMRFYSKLSKKEYGNYPIREYEVKIARHQNTVTVTLERLNIGDGGGGIKDLPVTEAIRLGHALLLATSGQFEKPISYSVVEPPV